MFLGEIREVEKICGLVGISISVALLSACAKTEENRNTENKMETEAEEMETKETAVDIDYKSLHCFFMEENRVVANLRAFYEDSSKNCVKIEMKFN